MKRLLLSIFFSVLFTHIPSKAFALNMKEFTNICDSVPGKCSDHPIVQAYVGGALDLIAVLDEDTNYLNKIYCKAPNVLFDIHSIVTFMQNNQEQYSQRNAMVLVIRYLEVNGGC